MKKECEKGLPVVLLIHKPLYEPALYERRMGSGRRSSALLVGVPEALMQGYPPSRFEQLADEITRETIAYIEGQPLIKVILAGYIYGNDESLVANRIPQITTGKTTVRLVEIT